MLLRPCWCLRGAPSGEPPSLASAYKLGGGEEAKYCTPPSPLQDPSHTSSNLPCKRRDKKQRKAFDGRVCPQPAPHGRAAPETALCPVMIWCLQFSPPSGK